MAQRKETPFLKQVFSENDTGSFSRVATQEILIFALGWVTYLVVRNGAMPDLAGLTFFIGMIYGANMAKTAITSRNLRKSAKSADQKIL